MAGHDYVKKVYLETHNRSMNQEGNSYRELPVFDRIVSVLEQHGASYRKVSHEPTYTSEQSAEARNEPLEIGAKAIVLKIESTFGLFVLSAADRLDTKRIRTHFRQTGQKIKKLRFATSEELAALTGLEPGAVPPFGRPVLDLELYVDVNLTKLDRVAFNAGSLTNSIILQTDVYLKIAQPTIFSFTDSVTR